MSDNVSLRIINFLEGLPQFHNDIFNGKEVIRRITDGTVFIAPEDPDLHEDGLLTVYWQGDLERCSEQLMGEFIAGVEIAEAARLWVAMGEYDDYKWGYSHLAQHFAFKTGASVPYVHEAENELMIFLGKAARKIGGEALMSIIKASIGMP